MSTAPDEALLTIDDHPIPEDRIPKRLGTITLDVAVTHSINKHRWGRGVGNRFSADWGLGL